MNADRLASESVVLQAPASYRGSARRLWALTRPGRPWAALLTVPLVLALVLGAWGLVTVWYLLFGLFLAPFRLVRRGSRKRRREELRHREVLEAAARR